ncbi:hypothetical protein CSC2_44790 [Clostridium zeae]|uniref:VanZ-like domain-containing protein n=1 Tax=Clostridium zeae TaxID=2759022 RepID=A0ABQ1EGJ8_9CLOT|nr:VanZ family protein [Clostridium zeae]GFZ33953.1 hypothetical protein CSC2_44790 [Clostridium zeae]
MKKGIVLVLLFWAAFIFYMSSKPGIVSHNMSGAVVNILKEDKNISTDNSNINSQNKAPNNTLNNGKKSNVQSNSANKTQQNVQASTGSSQKKSAQTIKNSNIQTSSNAANLDYIVRKNAHAFEYIVLAVLVNASFFAFDKKGKQYLIYILFICLFFAVTDEFHQSFVSGRTSLVSDVLIDFGGSLIGICLFYVFYYIVFNRRLVCS